MADTQRVNMRFDDETTGLIERIQAHTGETMTGIVKRAVRELARKEGVEMRDPRKFNPQLFKAKEVIEREKQEAEERTYALWERVHTPAYGYGTIVGFSDKSPNLVWVDFELNGGHKDLIEKRLLDKAEQLPPSRQIEINTHEPLGAIVEYHGHRYQVTDSSYISAKEAAEIEDAHDVFNTQGWHTLASLID